MAVTENTTAPDVGASLARDKSGRGQGSLLQVLVVAAAAAFLLYLAYPRLQASISYLPVDTAIKNYHETREFQSGQLTGLRERAQQAIETYPHYRYWEGLSLLYYLEAASNSNPLYERRQAFEQSITAAETSLSLAPSQPRTWLRIAQARSWLRYPPEQVIDALKMAIYTGRVEPSMFMTRLTLGLAYLQRMESEGQAMMRDQVLLAWTMQPRDLARALKDGTVRMAGIEQLLFGANESTLAEIREAAGGSVR